LDAIAPQYAERATILMPMQNLNIQKLAYFQLKLGWLIFLRMQDNLGLS
jgi:hypothetical protein